VVSKYKCWYHVLPNCFVFIILLTYMIRMYLPFN